TLAQGNVGLALCTNCVGNIRQLRYERISLARDRLGYQLASRPCQNGIVPAGEPAGHLLGHHRPFLMPDAGHRDVACAKACKAPVVPAENHRRHVLDIIVRNTSVEEVGVPCVDAVGFPDEMPDEVDLMDRLLEDLAAGQVPLSPPVRMQGVAVIATDVKTDGACMEFAPTPDSVTKAVHESNRGDDAR